MAERTCPRCGSEVPASIGGRPRTYCSEMCQKRRHTPVGDERVRMARRGQQCQTDRCNRPVKSKGLCQKHYDATPERREKTRQYHRERYRTDPEWRARANAASTAWSRAQGRKPMGRADVCPSCGKSFPVMNGNQRYCSKDCRPVKKGRKHHPHKWHYEIIGAKLHTGQLVELRLKQNEWGGFLVPCPECRCIMGIRPDIDSKYDRWCMWCEIPLSLDEGDVEWANYVMLSTDRLPQAA